MTGGNDILKREKRSLNLNVIELQEKNQNDNYRYQLSENPN